MASSLATPLEGMALRRRVLHLSWPAVAEQWLNVLVGLVTTFLVGHLGAAPLAAVGLGEQVIVMGNALFAAVGVGSTAIIARHVGAKEFHLVGKVVQQSFIIAAFIGIATSTLVMVFADSFFFLFQAKPEVVALGGAYLRIAGSGLFLSTLMFVGAAILRGAGDTRTPMMVVLVVNGINVILSLVLINGIFGLPGLEVTGAGLATAIARNIGGIIMVSLVIRGRGYIQSDLLRNLSFDTRQIKRILKIGVPAGLEMVQTNATMVIFAMVVGSLGTVPLAAHVVAMRIDSIAVTPGFGLGVATTILVGQGLGAGRPDLARKSGYLSQAFGVAIVTALGAVMFFFAEQSAALFVSDPEVIKLAATLIRIMALGTPGLATLHVLAGGLRGAGDTRWVMVTQIVGMWGGRVATGFLLSSVFGLGAAGAWIAMVADMYVRGGLCWRRFASGKWQRIVV